MPWKTSTVVAERERWVLTVLLGEESFATLCRRAGISRKTGYKWLARFHAGGRLALADASRRPKRPPRALATRWQPRVREERQAHRHWGARKLQARLRERYPRSRLPAVRTIGRWLQELGLLAPQVQRAWRGPARPHPGLTVATHPHHVWTLDFKGWIRTADGVRQEPLTVRDAFTRYLLEIRILPEQSDAAVRQTLLRLFHRHGRPAIIRVDNGTPFAGRGALGLSRLSVWWWRLGIAVEFTRRARPGDNAAHEQLHRCYHAEVLAAGAPNRHALQRRSDRWRQQYNHVRPHEALGQKPPAQRYRKARRQGVPALPPLTYPPKVSPRHVRRQGEIKWQGRLRFIGRAFAGQWIGLQAVGSQCWKVRLGTLVIGHLHADDPFGMRPAYWLRLPAPPPDL